MANRIELNQSEKGEQMDKHMEHRVVANPGAAGLFTVSLLTLALAGLATAGEDAGKDMAATLKPDSRMASGMTLPGYVQSVVQVNNVIASQRLNQMISEEDVVKAASVFEPVASVSANRSGLRQKNTAEEDLVRQNLGIYERRNTLYEAGVSVLAPTGATVEAKLGMDAIRSNLQVVAAKPKEYKSYYDLSLTQPLARDRGIDITRARVRMAELDASAAGHGTREVTTSVVSDAISAYLELALAQSRDQLWREGVRMAERLLDEAKSLYRQGRMAETALLDVENSLVRYRVGANESRQRLVEAMNKGRSLMLATAQEHAAPLVALDPLPEVQAPAESFTRSMEVALQHRPDYHSRQAAIEREGVRVVYAQNQTLPRVDLVASYGINGLEYGAGQALDALGQSDFPSWKIGLQASIPLGGNRKASAELRSARMGKEKALLDLKGVETAIANDVDNSLAAIDSSYQRWQMYGQVLTTEERQLSTERRLLEAGRSDMRNVLAREEAMIRTRTALLEQSVAYARAKMSLAVAQGTLLDNYITPAITPAGQGDRRVP